MSELPSSGVSPEARQTLQPIRELVSALAPLLDNADGFDVSNVRLAFRTFHPQQSFTHLLAAEERARLAWKAVESWLTPLPPATPESCDVCRRQSHAKWHQVARGDVNPVALISWIEALPRSEETQAIIGYIVAIAGIDYKAMRSLLASEASAPLPPAPQGTVDEKTPWSDGPAVCTNCDDPAKPHSAYADFVGPFCEGCWERLREHFTSGVICPVCKHEPASAPLPSAAPPEPRWQPIKTAPKDGSWFWVRRDKLTAPNQIELSVFRWDARNDRTGENSGWFSGAGWWHQFPMCFTHWTPVEQPPAAGLPPPPSEPEA